MFRLPLASLFFAAAVCAAPVYTTREIALPAGRVQPVVSSFTNNGNFLVTTFMPGVPLEQWLWNGTAFQALNAYSDGLRNHFEPTAMNNSGLIAGIASTRTPAGSGSNPTPVVRQPDGSFVTLPLLPGEQGTFSPMAINDLGSVLGTKFNFVTNESQPFVWLAPGATPSTLPAPVPALAPFPSTGELNNQGSFIYTRDGTQRIVQGSVEHDTGLAFSLPLSAKINNQNQALIQGFPFDFHFWDGSALHPLSSSLFALDLNNNGDVLVHSLGQGLGIWRNGVVEILPPSVNSYAGFPFLPTSAALNDMGQILVGTGNSGSGAITLHTPVPEPGTVGLLAFGGALLVIARRSARKQLNTK